MNSQIMSQIVERTNMRTGWKQVKANGGSCGLDGVSVEEFPDFSESSFGFRPKRSAHQAVYQMQRYVNKGYHWVIDLDLEKFFDTINHDVLMSLVAKKVRDKTLLKLIGRY